MTNEALTYSRHYTYVWECTSHHWLCPTYWPGFLYHNFPIIKKYLDHIFLEEWPPVDDPMTSLPLLINPPPPTTTDLPHITCKYNMATLPLLDIFHYNKILYLSNKTPHMISTWSKTKRSWHLETNILDVLIHVNPPAS